MFLFTTPTLVLRMKLVALYESCHGIAFGRSTVQYCTRELPALAAVCTGTGTACFASTAAHVPCSTILSSRATTVAQGMSCIIFNTPHNMNSRDHAYAASNKQRQKALVLSGSFTSGLHEYKHKVAPKQYGGGVDERHMVISPRRVPGY